MGIPGDNANNDSRLTGLSGVYSGAIGSGALVDWIGLAIPSGLAIPGGSDISGRSHSIK